MKCVLLAAGHAPDLDAELASKGSHAHLEGVPKALLPGVGGKKILDFWWDLIKSCKHLFTDVYLVTNADKFKHFERWATASDFPVENLLNDGTTSFESRLGAVADLDLCLRVKRAKATEEEVMVIAGDMMFQDQKFDLSQLIEYRRSKPDGDLAVYYDMSEGENVSSRGIVEIDPFSSRIIRFLEKPKSTETKSRLGSVVFYIFRQQTLAQLPKFLSANPSVPSRTMGNFLSWLINDQDKLFYGMKLPTGFQLIGNTSLSDYKNWLEYFSKQQEAASETPVKFVKRAYARVGLMGNPSDGFFGKTLSLSIRNFWAEVTIVESAKLTLIPHPLCDPTEFGSLADLHGISSKEGYLGGLRLLQATCKKFYSYCSEKGVALPKRNFSLRYDTNIPRQVGLAGSSAIVTATLKALMAFFRVTEAELPKELQPTFILDVEVAELAINAGLQDRVVQVYEGLVSMDFNAELMERQGYGTYERLESRNLPPFLFLCYLADPSDSGKIHSTVRQRFDRGDSEVVEAMAQLADYTTQGIAALAENDWPQFAELMNSNFSTRRRIYGDECLGDANLRMVEIGSNFGAACKFPGSGGAIIGLLLDEAKYYDMKCCYEDEGFVVTRVLPNV